MKSKNKADPNIYILVFLAVFISLQDVCSPISKRINYSDGSIYQYLGHLITIGRMPYVDAFDHKGPLLYLLNAVSLILGRKGVWFVDLLFILTYAIVSYAIARQFLNSRWAFCISTLSVTALSNVYWIGNTPDWYTSIAILAVVFLSSKYFLAGKLSSTSITIIGISIAFCFWQKFTTIGVIGIYCVSILITNFISHPTDIKFIIRCILYCSLGFAIVSVPIILWLWHQNALSAMVSDYFLFSTQYGTDAVSLSEKSKAFSFFLSDKLIVLSQCAFVFEVTVLWILKAVRKENLANENFAETRLLYTTEIALLAQAMVNALPGRAYVQYKCSLYPCAFIEICIGLKLVLKFVSMRKSFCPQILAIIIAIAVCGNINVATTNQLALTGDDSKQSVEELATVKLYLRSGEKLAVASPDDAGLYLWTETESATTYPYIQADMYGNATFWKEYNRQLKANHPQVIVWATNWDVNYYLDTELLKEYEAINMGRLLVLVNE